MSVIDLLASSQNSSGTGPNKLLAARIAQDKDTAAVKELIANLHTRSIQSDCIKVLYEVAELDPSLVSSYAREFITLLDNKNNRMQWGAMTALDKITTENAALIYNALPKIITIADNGSVITKDHCTGILIKLCAIPEYFNDAYSLLIDHMLTCPPNQLPMYAEQALPVINNDNKAKFIKVLETRLPDVDKESKKVRIRKVLKKLSS